MLFLNEDRAVSGDGSLSDNYMKAVFSAVWNGH